MKLLWTIFRAMVAFSVAFYLLNPRETTRWLELHKPLADSRFNDNRVKSDVNFYINTVSKFSGLVGERGKSGNTAELPKKLQTGDESDNDS